MTAFVHAMPYGAVPTADGVRFRLWAPTATTVELVVAPGSGERRRAMSRDAAGWCEAFDPEARPGDLYAYRIDGGLLVPDPASRSQPQDVHGPSEIVDPAAFVWQCGDWSGRPWQEVSLYELHVGTFTPDGTFRAVVERLDHLRDLGITAVELMPVADFPGRHDWGYNGTLLFAPDSRYGRPEDLKALVDAAHARGLMMFLDVVYNHFGPDGNYLNAYAGTFFDSARHTPWGAAINFGGGDAGPVRQFFIENALYWLNEYRFDGLRFDAVHAIVDDSDPDILTELADTVRRQIGSGRHTHLALENDDNEARRLVRDGDGRSRHYVAQWNDDLHHAAHVMLTGETAGYYADYARSPARVLGRCLTEGFAYQGEPSAFRGGEPRGEPSAQLPPTAFVQFLQNHDQIGNRAFGDRMATLAPTPAVRAGLALLLLAPSPPMLFMGEEWGSRQPFQFFCDFGVDLRDSVRDGRRREFASFPQFADPAVLGTIPDPTDVATFERSRIDWSEPGHEPHAGILALCRELLHLRRREIVPRLAGIDGHAGRIDWQEGQGLVASWTLGDGCGLSLTANLAAEESAPLPAWPQGRLLFAEPTPNGAGASMPPWSAAWYLSGDGLGESGR